MFTRFVRRTLIALVVVAVSTLGVGAALAVTHGEVPASQQSGVDAQVAYVRAHWNDRNTGEYGSLGDTDCVNFASQSLIVRGWTQTDEWWHSAVAGKHSYSTSWISSTAMSDYLARHPELAAPLAQSQADEVALGDLVQFDWDNSGNRDHTGIVTRIDHDGDRTIVRYSSHSNDRLDQSVDEALALDGRGGTAYFWHLTR